MKHKLFVASKQEEIETVQLWQKFQWCGWYRKSQNHSTI